MVETLVPGVDHGSGIPHPDMVPLCLGYSNKETIAKICQQVAKLFEELPSAPQVIPAVPAPTRHKRYWTAEEDEFIRRQCEAVVTNHGAQQVVGF
jgi:uncharacterized protein (DUF885 family)